MYRGVQGEVQVEVQGWVLKSPDQVGQPGKGFLNVYIYIDRVFIGLYKIMKKKVDTGGNIRILHGAQ